MQKEEETRNYWRREICGYGNAETASSLDFEVMVDGGEGVLIKNEQHERQMPL